MGDAHEITLDAVAFDTVRASPRATVVPRKLPSGRSALAAVAAIRYDAAAFKIQAPIGAGGMGVVQLATQVALGRSVAIKMLRAEHQTPQNVEHLLAEAWLTGSLEHPNIVPVHDLRLDDAGHPLLVMKRIEGETWSDLLHRGQPLEEALRILAQVCNAIDFANARDIIHRDIKPANVMVGRFGEVYVVDWGVALASGETTEFAGTLPYAAPEMVSLPGLLTPRTDVYLLGAVLFEILTGEPPHLAETVPQMLTRAFVSNPAIPHDGPLELCDLARQCMQREPSARPATARVVRESIERFLEHRGSSSLAAEASRRLAELEALVKSPRPPLERLYDIYGQCRFGFSQALVAWPENLAARQGLRNAVRMMVRAALAHDDARTAALLLNDLDEPDEDLVGRVALQQQRDADRADRLKELARKNDPTIGQRGRTVITAILGTIWIVGPLLVNASGFAASRYDALTACPTAVGVLVLLVVLHFSSARWRSNMNVGIVRAMAAIMTMQIVVSLVAFGMGVPPPTFTLFKFAYWAIVIGVAAAALEPRMLPSAFAFALGVVIARERMDVRYVVNAGANAVFTLNALWVWGRVRSRAGYPRAGRPAS